MEDLARCEMRQWEFREGKVEVKILMVSVNKKGTTTDKKIKGREMEAQNQGLESVTQKWRGIGK